MVGISRRSFTVADLVAVGVRPISLASSLYRASIAGRIAAAGEVQQRGTFTYVDSVLPTPELARYISATMEESEEAMRTVFDLAMIAASLRAATG